MAAGEHMPRDIRFVACFVPSFPSLRMHGRDAEILKLTNGK